MRLERTPGVSVRAVDDLRFIRATMERAVSFTAVPGWGGVGMGIVALAAAAFAWRAPSAERWLATWLAAAAIAVLIGVIEMSQNVRREGSSLFARAGARFALSLLPAFFSGACLTWVLYSAGLITTLPCVWLLSYGTGVFAAGAASVRPVCEMGFAFVVLGALALISPAGWGDVYLALGFGGLHILFGIWIARTRDG